MNILCLIGFHSWERQENSTIEICSRCKAKVDGDLFMASDMKVELEKSIISSHWFFRIRWSNGRIAMTSEMYNRKADAKELGEKMALRLGCEFIIKE